MGSFLEPFLERRQKIMRFFGIICTKHGKIKENGLRRLKEGHFFGDSKLSLPERGYICEEIHKNEKDLSIAAA